MMSAGAETSHTEPVPSHGEDWGGAFPTVDGTGEAEGGARNACIHCREPAGVGRKRFGALRGQISDHRAGGAQPTGSGRTVFVECPPCGRHSATGSSNHSLQEREKVSE
jgi:hypothetical protein